MREKIQAVRPAIFNGKVQRSNDMKAARISAMLTVATIGAVLTTFAATASR